MKKIKVLQINAVYGFASTGRTMMELSEELKKNQFESYVAYSLGIDNEENKYIIGNKLDRYIHALLSRISGLQSYFSIRETKKLLKYIKEINPDIIHLRNMHSNYINFNLLLKYIKKNEIPLVLTLHDSWFYAAKNQDYNIEFDEIPESIYKEEYLLDGENKSWFFDQTKKMLSDRIKIMKNINKLYVIGVSKWITIQAYNSYLNEISKIGHIYNWIDLDVFKPKEYESIKNDLKISDKFVILGVSSYWTKGKGIDLFIEISKRLSSNDVIVLVGELNDNIDLPENIISVGSIHDKDNLSEFYSMADVFLNLSVTESFGKVSAEALACGTPVITNKYTANPEIVDYKTGIVLEKLDFDSIVIALDKIKIKSKSFYKENCVKRANDKFNMKNNVNQYMDLYKSIVANGGENTD